MRKKTDARTGTREFHVIAIFLQSDFHLSRNRCKSVRPFAPIIASGEGGSMSTITRLRRGSSSRVTIDRSAVQMFVKIKSEEKK